MPSVDDLGGEVVLSRRTDASESALLRFKRSIAAIIDVSQGSATIEVAGGDARLVEACREDLASRLGATDPPADEVPVTFWASSCHGPRSARRRIQAPEWSTLRPNYEIGTTQALEPLLTLKADEVRDGGRLLLFHGIPGTGKTSVLRALAREWAPWCSTHFITDPDGFLGTETSYMLDVLVAESSARDRRNAQWKLVVLGRRRRTADRRRP